MNQVTFKENPVLLNGDIPDVGSVAPNFKFVTDTLEEKDLFSFNNKKKVIMSVPSLDTPVCQTQTRLFNKEISQIKNTIGIVVSFDLPFAMKRFCTSENISNIINASDFRYQDFGQKYSLLMMNSILQGLLARCVYILDEKNQIKYVELVSDVSNEPDYKEPLKILKQL